MTASSADLGLRGLDLFVECMAHITLHPAEWRQDFWMETTFSLDIDEETTCGTAGCVAGWACHFSGLLDSHGELIDDTSDFGTQACQLFGLRTAYTDACSHLFAADNQWGDLYRIGAELFAIDRKVLHKQVQARVDEMCEPNRR